MLFSLTVDALLSTLFRIVSTTKCVADKKRFEGKNRDVIGKSFRIVNDVPNDVPIIQKINLWIS
jgi:hypothetical protein